MKKFLIMLILFFICGFICADLCMEELQKSDILIHLDVYKAYANAKLLFKDVFWSVFYERLKQFIIIMLLCFTPLKDKLLSIILSVFSFIWGFFFMSCIVELGIAGTFVASGAVLPHGIFYIAVLVMSLKQNIHKRYHYNNRIIKMGMSWLFLLLMFVTACVLEALMNTHFIPWVIRLSMI